MVKVIWAPAAIKDVESIAGYIARDSSEQAALFVSRVIEMTDSLEFFPESGRMIPELMNKNCREVIYGAYRIMYRIVRNEVWITGVTHAARDWRPESKGE